MVTLSEYLIYYKDRFLKNSGDVNFVKHAVEKLNTIEVTADAIMKTGIYKIVRELAKSSGPWTDAITPLYSKWRSLLLAKQNNSKPTESEVPCRSQNDVPKTLCNERVKLPANTHTFSESPKTFNSKPVVNNGANYPIKSSVAQDNTYFQNKSAKSEKQDVIINNGLNYPGKLSDTEKNVPLWKRTIKPSENQIGKLSDIERNVIWNRDVRPSENHIDKAAVTSNDAHFSGRLSNFEGRSSAWGGRNMPTQSYSNKRLEINNDGNYNSQSSTDEVFSSWNRSIKSPRNPISKTDSDKSTYFVDDGISELSNGPFGMINGFDHSLPSQVLNRIQNHFHDTNNASSSSNSLNICDNRMFSTPGKNVHNFEQNQNSNSSTSHNAHINVNALSPKSSKIIAETNTVCTASPNKTGKLPNPYEIDMKEGMFRVVKSKEDIPPAIARVRQMYNHDELRDNWDYAPKKSNKSEEKGKTPIKDRPISKNSKNSKVFSDKKNSEKKSHSTKSKNTPDKLKNNVRTNSENSAIKSEKRKLILSDSAISKSQSEKKMKEDNELLKTENSGSLVSPPKCGAKDGPLTNINASCEDETLIEKNSNMHKVNITEKSLTKLNNSSNRKGNSPIVVSIKHVDYAPIPENKTTSSHKTCDKMLNKGVCDEAAEKFVSSKKERTTVYSGKKQVQEVSSLRLLCIQMLKKNIESMKYTYPVPYDQLKPVLSHFTASRLKKIEENNPYLLASSDELWRSFCRKKFRDFKEPEPPETWRELYWKTREDQEKKLKNVTANISASMSKVAPERQIKLAVIESPKPGHKRRKVSEAATSVKPLPKETLNHKTSSKESHSSYSKTSKECNLNNHKKPKKAPVAPLMSKVKRTLGITMHKK